MAKCNQLTSPPFRGLNGLGNFSADFSTHSYFSFRLRPENFSNGFFGRVAFISRLYSVVLLAWLCWTIAMWSLNQPTAQKASASNCTAAVRVCYSKYCRVVWSGVYPRVDRGTFPLLFEAEGRPCVLSPPFFGGRHFCTNAHGIHWMIRAIFVKFSQLILMKIILIIATRCQILRLKCTKFNFRPCWGSLQRSPDLLAGFKGPTFKGKGGERRELKGPLYFFLRIYTRDSKCCHVV